MKIGILGGGQLGRMLALAAHPLGIETLLVDPTEGAPASRVASQLVAPYTDPSALDALAACDAVTFEFENVPDEAARTLAEKCRVCPPPEALRVAQDRLLEKTCFRELGIETPRFHAVDGFEDLEHAAHALGGRLVLKTRRFGYDGKGQCVVRRPEELRPAFESMRGAPAIAEELISFERELSIIACRGLDGQSVFYPLTQNEHVSGVLRTSIAPAPNVSEALSEIARRYIESLLRHFEYVGVLALELFLVGDRLLANEIAPRVHNSGHWTIEGARTSQFENHVRAVMGLPLGSAEAIEPSAMLNLLGEVPARARVLSISDAHLHDYGKEPRPGRKVGHVTVRAQNHADLAERIAALSTIING